MAVSFNNPFIPITVLVVVLHHFLKILSCLHNQLKFEFGDKGKYYILNDLTLK